MQDPREVAVTVDGASVYYDDDETNHSEGHSEPEDPAACQRALPPPDPTCESDAPYEGVHRHKDRNHPAVVDSVSAKPESPVGWVEEKQRGTQYLHRLIEGVRHRRSTFGMVESCELQDGQRNQSRSLTRRGNCREREIPPPRRGVPSVGLLGHVHCHLTPGSAAAVGRRLHAEVRLRPSKPAGKASAARSAQSAVIHHVPQWAGLPNRACPYTPPQGPPGRRK